MTLRVLTNWAKDSQRENRHG